MNSVSVLCECVLVLSRMRAWEEKEDELQREKKSSVFVFLCFFFVRFMSFVQYFPNILRPASITVHVPSAKDSASNIITAS